MSAAELEALLEGLGAALGERVADRDREFAGQFERLSGRFEELATAATAADQLAERLVSLDEAQRRGEEILGRLLTEVARLREPTDAKPDAISLPEDTFEGLRSKKKNKKKKR